MLMIELTVTDTLGRFHSVQRTYNANCGIEMRKPLSIKPEEPTSSKMVQKIYPNPATNSVQLNLNISTSEVVRINIIDATGTVKKGVTLNRSAKGVRTHNIPIGELKPRYYLLWVIAGSGIESHPLIIIP